MIKKLTILSIIVSFLGVLITPHLAHAASFDPGHIIDDIVFKNSTSMSVTDIQNFLNSKVPSCDTNGTLPATEFGYPGLTHAQYAARQGWPGPPYTCLRNYSEGGLPAAQIIYNLAQQYQVNPQVLIVTLQKESSLITDTWPLPSQYRSATGYGCPDSGPNNSANCNSNYFGFTNQLTNTAYMYHAIMTQDPNWYSPYVVGTNYIQWSPNASCGGTNVNIVNWSTAALYDYTPYQPNTAALNAGYGMGDSCSAYGNRNFFLYFTDWFGSTTGSLVTAPGSGVYLIQNGVKRPFPSEISFLSNGYRWTDVLAVGAAVLASTPDGAPVLYNTHYRDGKLINSAGGMFIIENGLKRPFPSESIFLSYGYKWSDALVVSPSETALIPYGQPLPYDIGLLEGKLITAPGVGVYLVQNGLKRPISSEAAFDSWSYNWSNITPLSSSALPYIPDGAPVLYNTHYRDGKLINSAGGMFIIENGLKRPFPSESIFLSYGYKWSDALVVSPSETALIPYGQPLPYDIGLLEGKLITAPGVGVYLVQNGLKRPFPSESIFLSYGYKWSDVLTIDAQEMSVVSTGAPMTAQ